MRVMTKAIGFCLLLLALGVPPMLAQGNDGTVPLDKAYEQRIQQLAKKNVALQVRIRAAHGRISSFDDTIEVIFKNPTRKNMTMGFAFFPQGSELVLRLRNGNMVRCTALPISFSSTTGSLETVLAKKTLTKEVSLSEFLCSHDLAKDIARFYLTYEDGEDSMGHYESNRLVFSPPAAPSLK